VVSPIGPSIAAGAIPGGPIIWQILNFAVSLGLVTLMFAIIFRALPDVKIPWKDVWLGSFITAILFLVGQVLIGIYIGFTNVGSSYGAASSLVVILVYIYYSAQIVFLGAEITQVYANTYGSKMGEKEAWMSFLIDSSVGELQIWSRPWEPEGDWEEYEHLVATDLPPEPPTRWGVGPSGRGLSLLVSF